MQNPLLLMTILMLAGCGGSPPVVPAVTSTESAAPTALRDDPPSLAELAAMPAPDSAPTPKSAPPVDPCLPNLLGDVPMPSVMRYAQPRIASFDPTITRVSIAHAIHEDGSPPSVLMMDAGECLNSINRGDTTGCDGLIQPELIAARKSKAGQNIYIYAWPKSLPNQAKGFTFKVILLGVVSGDTNAFVLTAIGSDASKPGLVAAPMKVARYVAEEAYEHEIYFEDPSRFYDLEELLDIAEGKDPCLPPAVAPDPPDPT